MKCDDARNSIPLFLYHELSFDDEDRLEAHLDECTECRSLLAREKVMHRALNQAEFEPPSEFLTSCRQDLRRSLTGIKHEEPGIWGRLRDMFAIRLSPVPAGLQPIGALALIAVGFFAARMLPESITDRFTRAGLTAPIASRVKYVEPGASGKIQIVIEETRQRTMSGSLEDASIQRLLVSAAQDPGNPGLRVESVDLLKGRPESVEVRDALLSALQHDGNPGVRLKALEGLKGSAGDPQVRLALSRVLLADKNPGVRTQVIDLLIQHKEDKIVGVLQELMRKEENGYVRMRCQKALREMNASVETF